MGLSPVLFVGIGGTGGKVLGVIRHHLARELRGVGVHDVPIGWQFLHIDVPAERDAEEDGQAFTLPKDCYQPLTLPGDTYVGAHTGLSAKLRATRPDDSEAAHVAWASWAPAPAAQVPVQLDDGAGQMRAVGRVAGLSSLARITSAIRQADLKVKRADNGLVEAGTQLGVTGPAQVPPQPTVFVVASMNGGSGSGMLMDVCDVLRVNGFPQPIAILFTPDVMAGTPAEGDAGLAPNAYLLINELMAGQWAVHAKDKPISRTMIHAVQGSAVGAAKGGPDAFVLVGRRNRNLSLASGPAVYGALGRMLAEMTLDSDFLAQFTNFVLANNRAAASNLGLQTAQGAGNGLPRALGLGFSRLTLGREFFADYARYRFLRACAEQLLDAHLKTGQGITSMQPDQLLQEQADRARLTFLTDLQLREYGLDAVTFTSYDDLLDAVSTVKTVSGRSRLEQVTDAVQRAVKAQAKSGLFGGATIATTDAGLVAAQRVEDATTTLPDVDGPSVNLLQEAQGEAIGRVEALRGALSERMARVVPESAAARGIPVTLRLLDDVISHLRAAAKELRDQAALKRDDARVGLSALRAGEGNPRKSFSANDQAAITHIADLAGEAFAGLVRAYDMELTAHVAEEIVSGLIRPWKKALEVARAQLEHQVRPSKVQEKPIDQWPGDDGVPPHFRPSAIDHVLDDVDAFPETLETLVMNRLVSGTVDALDLPRVRRESMESAAEDILRGYKIVPGEEVTPVARYLRAWQPDLGGTETPSAAQITALFSQDDLMQRIDQWLLYPQSATRAHIDMALRDFLTCVDEPNNQDLRTRRAEAFEHQFVAWLRAMSPLLRFSQDLMPSIHGVQQPEITPVIGAVDVPAQLGELQQDLTGTLAQVFPTAGTLSFNSPPRRSVTAFSFTNRTFETLVCDDIMEPIARAASPEWLYRRARPLAESVPLTPEARRALVTGWFTARLLGRVELTGIGAQTRARVRTSHGWQPIELSGIRPARPKAEYDAPGRVVEGIVIALIEAYRSGSDVPLQPYRDMIALGGDVLGHTGALVDWVNGYGHLGDSRDRYRLPDGLNSPEARADALQDAVDKLEAAAQFGLDLARSESQVDHLQWWATRDIESDLHEAFDALRHLDPEQGPGA